MDYLFICLMFYDWFEDIYLIQRRHQYRKCAAKFRPLLSINGHVHSDNVDNCGDAAKKVAVISRANAAKVRQTPHNKVHL